MSAPQKQTSLARVGFVVHPQRDISGPLERLQDWARRREVAIGQIPLYDDTRHAAEHVSIEECDLLVSIGGDGTTLGAIRAAGPVGTPVLGVACGSLGALTAIDGSDVDEALDRFAAGDWTPRRLPALEVAAEDDGPSDAQRRGVMRAYNDLVVSRAGEGQVRVAASVDGARFARFAGDGAIVSTAIGSSAYTLAAGGPLLAPELPAYVLTALPAHGGFRPPLVLGAEQELELVTLGGFGGARVEIDGQASDLSPARLRIRLEADAATVVRFADGEPLLTGLRRRGIISDSPRILADDRRGSSASSLTGGR